MLLPKPSIILATIQDFLRNPNVESPLAIMLSLTCVKGPTMARDPRWIVF